tara:strand:- start:879 stop:1280 length:402 start_codon:yes stop_codon:yes gene_type:complete
MKKKIAYEGKFVSYIQNSQFGMYYLPARFQYVILRDYFNKFNKPYIIPQVEPVFSKTQIRLRSIIKSLKPYDNLILISVYNLSKEKKLRDKIIESIIKKKIVVHFLFEGIVTKSKKDFNKINTFFRFNSFLEK